MKEKILGDFIYLCTLTGREYGEELEFGSGGGGGGGSKDADLAAFNLSSRNRKLRYKDKEGKDVEVLIDVPWGIDVGDAIEDEEEHDPLRLTNFKNKNESPPYNQQNLSTEPRKRKRRTQDEEDVYAHVELGPYGMDGGGNLDFREFDEAYENLGDYETMRGQIGGEDDIVEEFKEDEEQEFERDIALLDYRLDNVREQAQKQVENSSSNPTEISNTSGSG